MGMDQRHAVRYTYQCHVVVAAGAHSCITKLDNLSDTGCCIFKPTFWIFNPNDVLKLFIIVDHETVIEAEAALIWEDNEHAGLAYLQPHDVPIKIIDRSAA